MSWTLTATAARLGGLLRRDDAGEEPAPADGTLFSRAFARAVERATPADAKALEVARGQLGDRPEVIERAVASGAPISAVAALAAAWEGMGREARGIVAHPAGTGTGPVRWGSVLAAQVDQTTCGAATMGMMRMIGDPFVALWVGTGRSLGDHTPPEAIHAEAEGFATLTVEERWQALQRVIHAQTTTSALGPVAWPRSLGTPPWKVDDRTRFAGLRFAGRLVDDSTSEALAPLLAHARRALADGIPVPLFSAGDSSLGLDTVIPRHVVLLVRDAGNGFDVYEPGAGAVLPLADADLHPGAGRLPALGHWSRAAWLIMPVRARRG
ncbi:hypothetical protein QQX10_11865 [Demequina sp. SYSU T00039]|uniref:Peptidase_C39 like family protein n=1 Tax=Demequina lignilytica TaxID=3051663 RepID=A0AAW7M5E3_9MICO|nr:MULTISPECIES: hypothetical protein [unclassified Demequina]MDN4478985.1 hypothetical protein [Demequina sp. SYSU T00039-1]MDN4488860.1 hypothetical protein [Demequina sp. SYSU T00039]MDN4491427.1 hypothetical protein [Demequina sp. SYSU T00068]